MLFTHQGKVIRFEVTDVRVFAGRDSNGVRGIRLAPKDSVMSMTVVGHQKDITIAERYSYLKHAAKLRQSDDSVDESTEKDDEDGAEDLSVETVQLTQERLQELADREEFILTVTEKGFGKRTSFYEYRTIHRGGSGIRNISITSKNGPVIASFPVTNNDDIMLVTDQGQLIRCPVNDIRMTGRNAQGVIVFRVNANEKVVAVSCIEKDETEADTFEELPSDEKHSDDER